MKTNKKVLSCDFFVNPVAKWLRKFAAGIMLVAGCSVSVQASAAVNYLVITGSGSVSLASGGGAVVRSATMIANIATSCPGGGHVIYYGLSKPAAISNFPAMNTYPELATVPNTIFCIAGVPSNVTLTPTSGGANISLTVGGASVSLVPTDSISSSLYGTGYATSVGILLPDSKAIALIVGGMDGSANSGTGSVGAIFGIWPDKYITADLSCVCLIFSNVTTNSPYPSGNLFFYETDQYNTSCFSPYITGNGQQGKVGGPNYVMGY